MPYKCYPKIHTQLTPQEIKVLDIAKEHLGSSFNIEKYWIYEMVRTSINKNNKNKKNFFFFLYLLNYYQDRDNTFCVFTLSFSLEILHTPCTL